MNFAASLRWLDGGTYKGRPSPPGPTEEFELTFHQPQILPDQVWIIGRGSTLKQFCPVPGPLHALMISSLTFTVLFPSHDKSRLLCPIGAPAGRTNATPPFRSHSQCSPGPVFSGSPLMHSIDFICLENTVVSQ